MFTEENVADKRSNFEEQMGTIFSIKEQRKSVNGARQLNLLYKPIVAELLLK